MKRYVIVGNGVAGTTAAEHIRHLDKDGKIDIFTDESTPFYTRIRLPEYIAGLVDEEKLILRKPQWYRTTGAELHLEECVQGIDLEEREVHTAKGTAYPYDRLLLTTGSHSFVPPIKGVEKPGVFSLRSLTDAKLIRDYALEAKRAILIGGGVLGLEAGNGLRRRGIEVTVVSSFQDYFPDRWTFPVRKSSRNRWKRWDSVSFWVPNPRKLWGAKGPKDSLWRVVRSCHVTWY